MCTLTVNSIDEAKAMLATRLYELGNPMVAFIGQRASDVWMFKPFMQIDLVICLDHEEVGIPTISLEKILGKKELWYSDRLIELFKNAQTREAITSQLPKGSLIIPYASFPELEEFCKKQGYTLLGQSSKLRKAFENKASLVKIKTGLCLPTSSTTLTPEHAEYDLLVPQVGGKFVIQNPNGSSGTGTFIIESEGDIRKFSANFANVLIATPFHEGLTISVNFVITNRQILYVNPSIQVVGQPELSISGSTFSGVDYPLFNSVTTEKSKCDIKQIVQKIAEFMKSRGFRGVANVNIMLEGLELTDINARFMGSGLLTVESQLKQNVIPISLVHVLQFLGVDFKICKKQIEKYSTPLNTSMIVLHNLYEDEKTAMNSPISRTFFEGSVLDKTGRLLPIYQQYAKENQKCTILQ